MTVANSHKQQVQRPFLGASVQMVDRCRVKRREEDKKVREKHNKRESSRQITSATSSLDMIVDFLVGAMSPQARNFIGCVIDSGLSPGSHLGQPSYDRIKFSPWHLASDYLSAENNWDS